MKRTISILLLMLLGAAPAAAQIPAEWQAAAQAVIGELERDQPQAAAKPWGPELSQGWQLARAWRKHNNGNVEIILAEYLMFVALCRRGCANSTVEGQNYIAVAEQVKGLRNQNGGPYALAANAHAWLAALPDPTGAAKKNAAMWEKDPDVAAADFATGNIYALAWLLARNRPTPQEQASAFAGFALFVQGKAWIGERCLDISKVATVLGAPPRIDACR
ncbi:MAG: hypothetical protein IKE60_15460 [Reyranella sp.]|jgi:hypothetical protein|uniref:hypothetical protein n=1 Tax=Reyranella sp. TaxID=1929291 RepID=UPI0025FBB40F|nr:hypothetical protein [Reyranella sp.]MBR2816047.1 hypothetical protein [Reyranella sp.]